MTTPVPLRVLLVEDSPSDAKLVARALASGGRPIELERVETADAMRAALERQSWDIVISDWSMPKFSALAALEVLRQSGLDLPFIIVSGTVGEEHAVAAMRAGAHDYVLKDKLARLAPAVERELREHQLRLAHRRAESARLEGERRMRRIIESSMVGAWFFDNEGNTTFMNSRMAGMLGLAPDEAAHARVADFVDDPDGSLLPGRIEQRRAGIKGSYEQRFRRKDGTFGWALFEASPLQDESGAFEGILTLATEITERRKAEEARREAELRFRRTFDSGIIGVTVADAAGAITEANQTFLTMLGYDERDLSRTRLSWRTLTPPEWLAQTARVNEELRVHGSARPFEKEYFHKDGSRVPVLVGAAALDGSRVLTVVTNLTERRRAEEANVALAEQLRQAQKMEAIGRLAGGVAHDFNNALSVILSYSELLIADAKEGDPARDDLEEIRRAGRRGADMTRQLLMFSRQQVVQPRVLDIDELLAGMERMLRRLVGEDVEMTLLPGASGRVRVDPGSIEQVLMNLVVNARDAMPTGGAITIETSGAALDDAYVQSHPTAKAGAYVVLSVCDTGAGMDSGTLAHIFEPFFTTKEKGKGTGLGLSTVFGIVRQSEGHIEVDSEPGQGTTFRIYLPCVEAAADVAPPPPSPRSLRGSETVLLVEDEDQVRNVAEGILRRHGYRVLVARNAGEAMLHFDGHPEGIDLLLTDVVMPQLSGAVLAKRLVSIRPALKVLFMSGYTDDETLRHGLAESAFSYLQKPLTVDSLTRKVREVLEGGSGRE